MPTVNEAYKALIDSTDEGGINQDGLTAEQIFLAGAAHGAAAEREAVLAIVTTLERIQVEGQWYVDLDEIERRIRARAEEEGKKDE